MAFAAALETPNAAERYAMTITNLARQLAVFERYERRAWAKREQVFERLYAQQSIEQASGTKKRER